MNKFTFIFFFMFLLGSVNAQSINENTFIGYQWATENNDSSFFQSDTVRIIKLKKVKGRKVHFEEDLADYYRSDFILIKFKSRSKLQFFTILIDSWLIERKEGKYSWNFSTANQTISLLLNKKNFKSFKVISKESVYVKSSITGNSSIRADELLLVKLPPR